MRAVPGATAAGGGLVVDGRVIDVAAEVLMGVLVEGGAAVVVDVGMVVAVGAVMGALRTSQST